MDGIAISPSPPATAPSVPLDAQYYPHILEAIVTHSPPHSLLAFRACSRALRDQADDLLFAHVEVVLPTPKAHDDDLFKIYPDCAVDVVVKPFGTNICFEWLRSFNHPLEPDGTVNNADLEARSSLRAYVRTRMMSESVQVIDLPRADFDLAPMSSVDVLLQTLEAKGLYDNKLVRLMGHGRPTPGCKYKVMTHGTQVIFGAMDGVHSFKRIARPFLCRPGDVAAGRTSTNLGIPRTFGLIRNTNVVIHLLSAADAPRSKRFLDVCTLIHWLIAESSVLTCPHIAATITVVGGAKELRMAAGIPMSSSYEELMDAVHEIYTTSPLPGNSSSGPGIRSLLRFLTPAEYQAEVGHEQMAAETKPDPFNGPSPMYIE